MKIKHRLFISFGILGILALLLGILSTMKMLELSQLTETMYCHPLIVGNAMRDIRSDIADIQILIGRITAKTDKKRLKAMIAHIDFHDKQIQASFKVLFDRFWGKKRQLEDTYLLFMDWKPIRNGAIQIRVSGQAEKITQEKALAHVEKLNDKIQEMIKSTDADTASFVNQAEETKTRMLQNTIFLLVFISIAIAVMTFLMNRNIATPIRKLNKVAKSMRCGNLAARSNMNRSDEIGSLSQVLDAMADSVERSMQELKKKSTQLSQVAEALALRQKVHKGMLAISKTMAVAPSLEKLLDSGLDELMRAGNIQVGAIYLYDGKSKRLEISCSLGYCTDLPKSLMLGQGSAGLAAKRREIRILSQIPADTDYLIKTVNGESIPMHIIDLPLVLQDRLIGVVSLASIYPLDAKYLEIIEHSQAQFATAIENARNADKTSKLARELGNVNKQLETRNTGLEMQSLELQRQTDELRMLNVELESQRLQVESANQLKSEFLSNMSHELRTPLNSILALSQLMLEKRDEENLEKDREFLQIIDRNGHHLLNLINDLLDLAKIEAGKMEIAIAKFKVERVVQEVIATIRPLAQKKNLQLKVDITASFHIYSDEHRIRQILINLLSNAVKFTECGQIELTVRRQDDQVYFVVKDSGIGITPKQLPHIFSEFRQADGSITRQYGGTGLGLAICAKTAKLLGGKISVESEIARGSCFTLSLPLEKKRKTTKQKLKKPGGRKVLVVEDNEIAALQIQSVIEDCGFSVTVAPGGTAALKSIKREIPDAVVLDLMMPEIDGFLVLEMLRANPKTMNLPVLVLTAKELSAEEKSRLKSNDIDQLIQKGSIDREQLITAVLKLLGKLELP